jgi:hypothetical protein
MPGAQAEHDWPGRDNLRHHASPRAPRIALTKAAIASAARNDFDRRAHLASASTAWTAELVVEVLINFAFSDRV